ncbi:MAG: cobalamin-dependent protein [Pseudomonadota bacterium]
MKRAGRRVALVGWYPPADPALPPFIPNLGLYMVAAALDAAGLDDVELRIWDERDRGPEAVAAEIAAFDPDIVAGSVYVWSLPQILAIAGALADQDPGRLIVLGGPSARPNMLAHAPFADAARRVDVLVEGEGEGAFPPLVADRRRDLDSLRGIGGLRLRANGGWLPTGPGASAVMDRLASPYVSGRIPRGGIGIMETYRGCPFSCSFCEWGVMDAPKNVRGPGSIRAELDAMASLDLRAVLLADAGLNLNNAAFESLRRAAEDGGRLRDAALICEVYPTKVRRTHIDFLAGIGSAHIGVGLQSFDEAVLGEVERRQDEERLPDLLGALREVSHICTEIIMGLPGDTPEGFLRSFARARELGTALRVYHCVVLPSALMARSPKEHALDYDPASLKMRACLGWPPGAIDAARRRMDEEARAAGGHPGDYFWVFPPP